MTTAFPKAEKEYRRNSQKNTAVFFFTIGDISVTNNGEKSGNVQKKIKNNAKKHLPFYVLWDIINT